MSSKAIEVKNLTKKFKKVEAVKNISFNVDYGELFAFLGPNGAGKSTTIRILTTLAKATSGDVKVGGYDVKKQDHKVRQKIGLVSDKLILYDKLTAYENVKFFAELYVIDKQTIKKRADNLFEMLEMTSWKDSIVNKFSTGMKQKINIARALITEPDIIFLDEPTLGLDPHTTKVLRGFIKKLNKEMGKTIILTTHELHEVEVLADTVAIINDGEIVAKDTKQNLKSFFKQNELVEFEVINKNFNIKNYDYKLIDNSNGKYKVEVDNINNFIKNMQEKGVKFKNIKTYEPSIEDIFVKITENKESV